MYSLNYNFTMYHIPKILYLLTISIYLFYFKPLTLPTFHSIISIVHIPIFMHTLIQAFLKLFKLSSTFQLLYFYKHARFDICIRIASNACRCKRHLLRNPWINAWKPHPRLGCLPSRLFDTRPVLIFISNLLPLASRFILILTINLLSLFAFTNKHFLFSLLINTFTNHANI